MGDSTNKKELGLLVGRCLIDLGQDTVLVKVLNPSPHECKVVKGSDISSCGVFLPQTDGTDAASLAVTDTPKVRKLTRDSLPQHLQDLVDRSVKLLDETQQSQTVDLLTRFADVFSRNSDDLGRTNLVQHQINTTERAAPIRQPARRLPMSQCDEAQRQIEKMEKQKVIEPSASPWASPVVLVKKKDGGVRFCVDYRRLNAVTKEDSYPLPRIDESLETLADSRWFSTLDLRSDYWQVGLDPEDKEKIAFSTGQGLWQFTVMPFGLCNTPATFERLMEQVFHGLSLDVCLLYLDDILVPGKTFDHHLHNLTQVLQCLRDANLKLSPEKTTLFQKQVTFLGHVVGEEGISTDPTKINSILSWPVPGNTKELKRFLGLCSYYRRFIPGFSNIAQPFHWLAQVRDGEFDSSDEANTAFDYLKEALSTGIPKSRGGICTGHRCWQLWTRSSVISTTE